jgi:hypothetical protein
MGGSSSAETIDTMDPDIKERLLPLFDEVTAAREAGEFTNVAGLTDDQLKGMEALRGGAATQDEMAGLAAGIAGGGEKTDTEALKNAAAYRAEAMRKGIGQSMGTLQDVGGGRRGSNDAVFAAEMAAEFAGIDYDAMRGDQARQDAARKEAMAAAPMGGESMMELGGFGQDFKQKLADQPFEGYKKMFGLLDPTIKVGTQQAVAGK